MKNIPGNRRKESDQQLDAVLRSVSVPVLSEARQAQFRRAVLEVLKQERIAGRPLPFAMTTKDGGGSTCAEQSTNEQTNE